MGFLCLFNKNAKNSNAYIFNGIIALASMLFFVITDKIGSTIFCKDNFKR